VPLKITLVGSRYFGATVLDQLAKVDVQVLLVVTPAADDRLALRAQALGIATRVQHDARHVPGAEIADGTELIVCAHTHARVDADALAKARLGGIGYHPSLLPRHRGIAAVEWTVKCGDAIAGGSIYHLAERMDAGAIAAQDWCFVKPGEGARELWERALAPLGIRLLTQVVAQASATGVLPAQPQDEQFATLAPKLRA
jgi:methionyl-tRNA formyltransferase